jgi:hypothetical protein
MTPYAAELFGAAVTLDESPEDFLNGGAAAGLQALHASASVASVIAAEKEIDPAIVDALWDQAVSRLTEMPAPDNLFAAAAEAANLLYAAAWVLEAVELTADDVRVLF